MKQESKTIYDFKKGDSVTRLRPIIQQDGTPDYGFVGKELVFLGIANASAYLSKKADFFTTLLTGKDNFSVQIPLDLCEDGWAEYAIPDFLDDEVAPGFELSEEDKLEYEILKASEAEDYTRADILQKKLAKLRTDKGEDKE